MPTGFWWQNLRERDNFEHLFVDGRIILKRISREFGCGEMDWMDLAQYKDRCRAFVNAKIIHRVS